MKNLSGIKALPPFYAASYYAGPFGVAALILGLLALVITSLIGQMYALSRLIYALAQDGIMNEKLAKLNKNNCPAAAIDFIALISFIVPFLGRTAIGWIVDVTTIFATVIYGFISYIAFSCAKKEQRPLEKATGIVGLIIMSFFFLFLIVPNFFKISTIENESHFLFIVQGVIGFLVFHRLVKKDTQNRLGKSIIPWIAPLGFILLISLVWMINSERLASEDGIRKIHEYLLSVKSPEIDINDDYIVRQAFDKLFKVDILNTLYVVGFFTLSVWSIISNILIMRKRETEHKAELGKAQSIANTDTLTGVKSKHAYHEYLVRLEKEIEENSSMQFAFAVCDVNNLKVVNDTQGHKAGDEYIKRACRLICAAFQHSPVFRIGGDEFVAILRGQDYENRKKILEDFNLQIEENLKKGEVIIASGCSEYDSSKDSSVSEVFERADFNMYTRKKALKGIGV